MNTNVVQPYRWIFLLLVIFPFFAFSAPIEADQKPPSVPAAKESEDVPNLMGEDQYGSVENKPPTIKLVVSPSRPVSGVYIAKHPVGDPIVFTVEAFANDADGEVAKTEIRFDNEPPFTKDGQYCRVAVCQNPNMPPMNGRVYKITGIATDDKGKTTKEIIFVPVYYLDYEAGNEQIRSQLEEARKSGYLRDTSYNKNDATVRTLDSDEVSVGVGTSKASSPTESTSNLPGTWRWFNGAEVVISGGGGLDAGPIKGRWRLIDPSSRTYTFEWANGFTDTMREPRLIQFLVADSRLSPKSLFFRQD